MSMNGIDISSHQSGINLSKVPCDFAIIKATQGTSYVNPDCDRAYQQAKKQENVLVYIIMLGVKILLQKLISSLRI